MNATNKTIHLTYYAQIREQSGLPGETIKTYARTAQELYKELKMRFGLQTSFDQIKTAVNDQFCPGETELKSDDHVVFIPPVSGG